MTAQRYPIPARVHRVEEAHRRSRFVTTLAHASDPAAAHRFVEGVRQELEGATHHCWAFVAGPPGSTRWVGMSDDGEPAGTAGRPMLTVLLHSGVGEVVAVVSRWFGGTKLGTGGLARAYAGGVKLGLEGLPTEEKVERVAAEVRVGYAAVDPLHRLLADLEALVEEEIFGSEVVLRVLLPEGRVEALRSQVLDMTGGKGAVRVPTPEDGGPHVPTEPLP